ncbi:TPA: hypothetical protein ACWLUJ_005800 [Pseudomonas aeruginosa]|nr:hypothetical protein [Pseudomonas aeruginosa]EIU2864209.1 hypothetical protein [Pseudomonas aeruginosa]HEJ2342282.1 hypothetical protein [Pseudomonas aeruginosa]HEK3716945.1 hypothetical protein [Pseudomonas aeruginosa]
MPNEHQDLAERQKTASAQAGLQGDPNDSSGGGYLLSLDGNDDGYLSVEIIESDEGSSIDDDAPEGVREYQSVEVHGVIVYGTAPGQRLPGYLSKVQKEMIQGLWTQIDLGAGADGERLRSLFAELQDTGLLLAGELASLRAHINRQVPNAGLVAEAVR